MPEPGGRKQSDRLATLKQEIFDLPRALSETLEKGRPEYDELVRHTRWGEGPIHLVADGPALPTALAGAFAFESLLGWPAAARPAPDFAAYSLSTLKPRSVLLLLPEPEPSAEIVEIGRQAVACGAVVLGLADSVPPPLAKYCAGWFRVRTDEAYRSGVATRACEQAAMSYLAFVAARALLRHQPHFDTLEQEFEKLPGHVQWMLTQLPDAAHSLAAELKGYRVLYAVGGGFYYPTALHWTSLLKALTGIHAQAISGIELAAAPIDALPEDAAVVVVSGSRSKTRKYVQRFVERSPAARHKIYSVTDTQDRGLAERSRMAILLPTLSEMVGSILSLALLGWVTYLLLEERRQRRG